MTVLGIIGTAVAASLGQQTRIRTRVATRLGAEAQLREAAAPLLADIATVSPPSGDIAPGEARDSTFEFSLAVLGGHLCAADPSDPQVVYFAPVSHQQGRMAQPGDSLTFHDAGRWSSAWIDAVSLIRADAAGCGSLGAEAGEVLRISLTGDVRPSAGAAARVMRRVRYSFYRASDGYTYLGLREWSARLGSFPGLQPVAGPFEPKRSRFAFLDSLGRELPSGEATGEDVAVVLVELCGARRRGTPPGDSAGLPCASLAVALRNRR